MLQGPLEITWEAGGLTAAGRVRETHQTSVCLHRVRLDYLLGYLQALFFFHAVVITVPALFFAGHNRAKETPMEGGANALPRQALGFLSLIGS